VWIIFNTKVMNSYKLKQYIKKNIVLKKLFTPIKKIYRRQKLQKERKELKKFSDTYNKIFSLVQPGTLVLKLEDFKGYFEIDIRSDIFWRIARYGNYEPDILKIITKHINPQMDVIDIGANIGLFSIYFSKILDSTSKVLAIEPTPLANKYLLQNIKRNGCESKVIVFEGIVSDKKGKVKLNTIPGMEEYSSLGKIFLEGSLKDKVITPINVSTETLDNLVKSFNIIPGFIKIDTEGSEYLVLTGAMDTLRSIKPTILSEICDNYLATLNNSSKDIINLLYSCNYDVFNIADLSAKIEYPFTGEIIAIPK